MQQAVGFLFVLLAGIGFGFLGVFGKLAFQSGLNIGELLTFRFALAALILFVGLLFYNPKLLKINLKQLAISAGLGIFGYAVFSTLYFKSIEGISVALAALLLFTFPIFVSLGAHFILKERMPRRQIFSLVLACAGLAVLLWGPLVVHSLTSVIFAIAAALAYSVYVLVSGRYQQKVPPLTSSLYVIISAGLALLVYHQPNLSKILHLTSQQFFIIFGIAVISTIGPLTLFLAGLQKLASAKASIIVMIEPVVAALAAWLLLGEQLTFQQSLGGGIVLLALFLNGLK